KLAVADLKRLWPQGSAEGARVWIGENVQEGTLTDGKVHVDVPAGTTFVDRKIPNEMLNLSFSIAGMRTTYLHVLPEIAKVPATAVLQGDQFDATIATGAIGTVVLKSGTIQISELHSRTSVGTITGVVAGPAPDMLAI